MSRTAAFTLGVTVGTALFVWGVGLASFIFSRSIEDALAHIETPEEENG